MQGGGVGLNSVHGTDCSVKDLEYCSLFDGRFGWSIRVRAQMR